MKKILLATDGSIHAANACREIMGWIKDASTVELTVVTVVSPEQTKHEALDFRKNAELLYQQRLQKIKSTLDVLKEHKFMYNVTFLHGDPAKTIINQTEKEAYDLLVIGSRGLNTLQEMVLGSVSHKVIKHAKCPVFIVK